MRMTPSWPAESRRRPSAENTSACTGPAWPRNTRGGPAAAHVPQLHLSVVAGRGEQPVVAGGEGKRGDAALMRPERALRARGRGGPQPHRAAGAAAGDGAAAGRDVERARHIALPAPGAREAARVGAPQPDAAILANPQRRAPAGRWRSPVRRRPGRRTAAAGAERVRMSNSATAPAWLATTNWFGSPVKASAEMGASWCWKVASFSARSRSHSTTAPPLWPVSARCWSTARALAGPSSSSMVRTSAPDPAFHTLSVPSAPTETIQRPWSSAAMATYRASVGR